jgi:hypothetical protein
VILVVDYTQISGESSAEVKEYVERAVKYIGNDKVYVLLNKFDEERNQPKDSRRSKDEVQEYFADTFLQGKFSPNNVFPISSRDAFYANLGLNELSKNSKISSDVPWVDEFGNIVLGAMWKDDIKDIERVKTVCIRKYENSNFDQPMESIIETSYGRSEKGIVESALNTLGGVLKDIEEIYHTNISSLRDKIDELKRKINEIHKDVDKMKEIHTSINNEAKKKREVIKTLVDSLLEEAHKSSKEQTSQKLKKKGKTKKR